MHIKYLLLVACTLLLFSCKPKNAPTNVVAKPNDTTQTYWPINQYLDGQVNLYAGEPLSLYCIISVDGRIDSSMVNAVSLDWKKVFKAFRETDISNTKFIGNYNFSMFDDDATGNRTMYYEAKDPNLYTQKLQITMDPTNYKVLSVYVESGRKTTWRVIKDRLLYIPYKIIQQQRDETPPQGPTKKIRIDYRFLQ
jgi:hypothetical protein